MNRKLLKLQLLGCGILGVVLAAEWGYDQYARQQLRTILDQAVESDFQADSLPELAADTPTLDEYSAIVERPLFIEGRKPIAEESAKEAAPVDVGQIDDWQLIGVYNKSKSQPSMALFRKQNEAKKYLKLNENQSISGWQVQKIQSDQVTLQQGGQQKIVPLRKPRVQPPVSGRPVPPKPGRPQGAPPPGSTPPPQPQQVPATNNPIENPDDESN